MRALGPPSEIGRLAAPVARLLDRAWQKMPWWIGLMGALYALSGITVVKSDEVAVILRWGRVVGDTPALQAHGPGLLFAFPRPIDRVVRVQTKHVWEVPVSALNGVPISDTITNEAGQTMDSSGRLTLDPITQGYALTGDQNIVHVEMVARYRVRDPALWAFYGPKAEDILRVEVTSAMVRSLGEMTVDRVLADGRKDLVATVTRRAQEGLDASSSGLELSSLELTRLTPPAALSPEFDQVQSAFISAETKKKTAQARAEQIIPQAQADVDTALQTARGEADGALANARGEAGAFLALEQEYRANPVVVRERLYRNAVEQAISSAGKIQWVPPPIGGNYRGFRITVSGRPAVPPGEDDEQ